MTARTTASAEPRHITSAELRRALRASVHVATAAAAAAAAAIAAAAAAAAAQARRGGAGGARHALARAVPRAATATRAAPGRSLFRTGNESEQFYGKAYSG
eukprot:6210902-Pleurochrysis_carterae.AAC.2